MNSQKQLLATFLDFFKTFDTVNNNLLIKKLDHIGIRGLTNINKV